MRTTRRCFLRRSLQAGLVCSPLVASKAANAGRTCRQNLGAIYDAVIAYRGKYGRLPPRLSTLVTAGLIDRRLLICPVLVSNGLNRPSNASVVDNLADDPLTRYQWEFSPSQSQRHEKQRIIGAGDWVPMVRCGEHSDNEGNSHLNLALNGAVFSSGILWETRLRHIVPFPYLGTGKIMQENPVVPLRERIPPRATESGTRQIDLGPAFNGAFTDSWPEGYEGEQAPEILKLGGERRLWNHGGIEFELRGVVQLEGKSAAAAHPEVNEPRFPYAAQPLHCDAETEVFHILCGVVRSQSAGTPAAIVSLEGANGERLRLELRHGVHLVHGAALSEAGGAAIAWSRPRPGILSKSGKNPDTAALSLSHVTWPLGRKFHIRRIILEAAESACYPFFCAVTVE
jgi:hypothetical protein